uniref:L-cystatin n=1 Tax=Cacopsylla melanoneura TaxID=428564 RepID=A0A8D8TJ38_9HEMI
MYNMKYSCVVLLLLSLSVSLNATPGDTIIPGGPAHINIDDPAVQEASHFAVSQISLDSDSPQQLGLYKVVSATRQVVAGALYTIKLQAGKTNCTKQAAPVQALACSVNPATATDDDPNFGGFIVKVWDQPWKTPRFKITSVEPADEKTKAKNLKSKI